MKGSLTFLLPSPRPPSQAVNILSGKVGCLKTHFKDEMASITCWELPCMADTDWCAARAPLHAAILPGFGIAGGPDAVTGC